ncbi:Rgg/GadR/MutR family transcriptional regulator [Ligilactobacillus araffinosus]|uniref:Transcriptional regulator n=1 Tax=Ligilactobacillus araffinosus DSM 20653 TaxID=1423820 RepID=A0A0R1ZE63_9LACO|nr:Rgg/GadR/MutR family transcriptional regulator [Ligilactobacillus araffinosus]KRM52945.1 transcriptional regulator [Ligilactobacillus araffinosus DSM 20653]
MNFGKAISNIRKNKHISIQQITANTITKSSYNRFINGETQPSINSFLTLLQNLHVSFEEFLYISRGYKPDYFNEIAMQIRDATITRNISLLQEIHATISTYAQQEPNNQTYFHLQCVTTLILNFLQDDPFDQTVKNTLLNYLLKCDVWTHYEHTLFNSVIFIFDPSAVNAMEKRIIRNLDSYELMHIYGNESFRSLCVILAFDISHQDLLSAIKVVSKLENFSLHEDMLFEKTLYKLFSGIVFLLSSQSIGLQNIKEAIQILQLTDSKGYLKAALTFIKEVCQTYHFRNTELSCLLKESYQKLNQ